MSNQYPLKTLFFVTGILITTITKPEPSTDLSSTKTYTQSNNEQSVFTQTAYMKATNTRTNGYFGSAMSASGLTLAVASVGESSAATGINGNQQDNSMPRSGAVYVYTLINGNWVFDAYIKASNTNSDDKFGTSISISDDTLVIGAPEEDSDATGVDGDQFNNAAVDSGAAYVYIKDNGIWSQQAYLKASNTEANDQFGTAVEIFNNTIVVGATNESSNSAGINGDEQNNLSFQSGAAYVFNRKNTQWQQTHYIKAFETNALEHFGESLSLNDEVLAIGAQWASSTSNNVNQGVVFIYRRSTSDFLESAYLTASNNGASDNFGYAIDLSGNYLAVSARRESGSGTGVNPTDNNDASSAGAAYIFRREDNFWIEEAYIKASNSGEQDQFGWSISLEGDLLAVSAFREDSQANGIDGDQMDNNSIDAGATYLFAREDQLWSQLAYIKASNTGAQDNFGFSTLLHQQQLFIGAHLEDSNATDFNGNQNDESVPNSGAVYIYSLDLIFKDGFEQNSQAYQ